MRFLRHIFPNLLLTTVLITGDVSQLQRTKFAIFLIFYRLNVASD